jgi:hypothetical protein
VDADVQTLFGRPARGEMTYGTVQRDGAAEAELAAGRPVAEVLAEQTPWS